MIYELSLLYIMITTGIFFYWPFHFFIYFLGHTSLLRVKGEKYRPYAADERGKHTVTVLIPSFREEHWLLEKAIETSIENNPDEVIVIHDDGDTEVEEIVRKYAKRARLEGKVRWGVKSFNVKERLRKRGALAVGWLMAKGDIIVQMDSDTFMATKGDLIEPLEDRGERPLSNINTLEEILRPFSDPRVVGVQGRPVLVVTGGPGLSSRMSYYLGQIIERARHTVSKAMDGQMIVIDGKITAYRRDWLMSHIPEVTRETYRGRQLLVGDDRTITLLANNDGMVTAYQSTAVAFSGAQPSLGKFIAQQVRWFRTEWFYLIKEIREGWFFSRRNLYRSQSVLYLTAPLSLLIAMVQALLTLVPVEHVISVAVGVPTLLFSLWALFLGLPMTTIIGLKAMKIKFSDFGFTDIVLAGFIGLFIIYPTMLYAMFTYRNLFDWYTR